MSLASFSGLELGKRKRRNSDDSGYSRLYVTDDDAVSDVSSDEEEYEPAPPLWSQDREEYPKLPAYHENLPGLKDRLENEVKAIHEIFAGFTVQTQAVDQLEAKIVELKKIPDAKPTKIALLGDTGAGKSSLINSVIDTPGLARQGGFGRSCTCVMTEYRLPFPGQAQPFAAQIQYLELEKIKTLVGDWIEDFVFYATADQNEWESKMKQQCQLKANTASTTLRLMFCDKEEFGSEKAAKATLDACADDRAREEIIGQILTWCEAHLRCKEGYTINAKVEYVEADTVDGMRAIIDPLISATSTYTEPALWPLVSAVSIGVRDSRILQYVSFVDLPGTSDTNQVRTNACEAHLDKCDALWVVARLDRVFTHGTVDEHLSRFAERFQGVTAVICTRSDDFQMEQLVADMEKEGKNLQEHHRLTYRMSVLDTKIAKLIKKNKRVAQEAEGKPLKDRITDAETKRDGLEEQRFANLVQNQNQYVKAQLPIEKQAHMPKGMTLPVYCVSNNHYTWLREGGIDKAFKAPRLSAECTEIPALRAYALSLPAGTILRTVAEYHNGAFSELIGGLEFWADASSVRQRAPLVSIVNHPQKDVENLLLVFSGEMVTEIHHCITTPLNRSQWECKHNAHAIIRVWEKKWKWNSLRAFIMRNGKWATSVIPEQSWNEQFIAPAEGVCRSSWAILGPQQTTRLDFAINQIIALIEEIPDILQKDRGTAYLPMNKFRELLKAKVESIKAAAGRYERHYHIADSNIKMNAFQDRHTGIFVGAMMPVYAQCKLMKGHGYMRKVFKEFRNQLDGKSGESPFATHTRETARAVEENHRYCFAFLYRDIMQTFNDIADQFANAIEEQRNRDPVEARLRLSVKRHIREATPRLEQIERDLGEIIMASWCV